MKLKNVLIGIIAAIVLLTIGVCFIIGTGVLNPLEHQLSLGYKYLEQGKYEEAILAFNKAIEIDDKKVDAYLGKAQAEIKLSDNEEALDTIETAIRIIADVEQTYSEETFKAIVEWWIENADSSNSSFEELIKLISENTTDVISSYEWGESEYETEEPYKEYQELYVNGKKTGHKKYTGYFATGKWINEGYEAEEPYKEFERLYLNSKPTDKIRYTGKTKPNTEEIKQKLIGTWNYQGDDAYAFLIDTLRFYSDGRVENTAMRLFYKGTYEVVDESTIKMTFNNNSGYAPMSDDGGGEYDIQDFSVTLKYDANSNTISVPNDVYNEMGYSKGATYKK